ncbi:MAG: argininosuccinate lyase [Bacillota bacterium]
MKLWSGRLAGTQAAAEGFTASIGFDQRLWREDIAGSLAHVNMLARQGIISAEEAGAIAAGLGMVAGELERGALALTPALEDIHTHIEARLQELIGEAAGKLHTARSRNDQVSLDERLWVKGAAAAAATATTALQSALAGRAESDGLLVLPGYTHTQRAQPVLLGHHLLAYFAMLERDQARFAAAGAAAAVSPLGAGALAGVTFPIDPAHTAASLGLPQTFKNSIDAVADRDFVCDYIYACALLMQHLSRLAADIILWVTAEFGFAELPDAYATGSSIMPQKKNPDVAELVRGKAGRVLGDLTGLLATMKGLPLAYNSDMQEDKEPLFDAHDTVMACVAAMAGLVRGLTFHAPAMRRAAGGTALATDLADYLARQGVPFRQAHGAVARLVRDTLARGLDLEALGLEDLQRAHPAFAADALPLLDVDESVRRRASPGGSSQASLAGQLAWAREILRGRLGGGRETPPGS